MNDPFTNPFDAADPDRAAIWEMLVARDCDAFAAGDWGPVADDFAADRFEGISAHGSADPRVWTLAYPSVEAYRADWLRMAGDFRSTPLVEDHRTVLYRMSALDRIELAGDRAAAWKQFRADEPLSDGGRWQFTAQTVYRVHRVGGLWKIAGFVGYLPLEV